MLNSTVTVLSKHQFGRAAGVEGNLKTEVVDVNMMLVPDVRNASPEAAARAVAACERMSMRDAKRYLYEEFTLDDRRRAGRRDTPNTRHRRRCRAGGAEGTGSTAT